MRDAFRRIPRLSARCLYMIALVVMLMLYDFSYQVFRPSMIILLFPLGYGLSWAAVQSYKGKLGLRNALILIAAGFFVAGALKSGDTSGYSLYFLGGCVVSMVGVGIVPEHTDAKTLHKELLAFAWAMIILMLPVMVTSLLSVFWGQPFKLGYGVMGLERAGKVQSRLHIVAHPNIGGRRAEMCVLFAIYALYYSKKRWQRVLLWFTMIVSVMVVAHSQTRSCTLTLSMIFGALVFRWIYLRMQEKKGRLPAALAGAAATAVLTVLALEIVYRIDVFIALRTMPALAHAEEIGASRVITRGLFDVSGSGRNPIWGISLRYLRAHPSYLFVGMGSGDITTTMGKEFANAAKFPHLHNSFLEILVRGGLPMLLCSVALLVLLVRPCYRMLIARETDGDKGAYILPIMIGTMLAMTVTETMLFVRPTVINVIFFLAVGRVVYAARHKTIGQPQ